MSRAVLCLGSNLGDRHQRLRDAVAGLARWVRAVSSVYETPPWGEAHQPPYLNAVVIVADDVPARVWLDRARRLEAAADRERDPYRRFGPRTLDVDVIAVWDDTGAAVVSDDPELTLPHPRAHLRAFVLRPWLDVDPDATLPGRGPVRGLLRTEAVATDLPDLIARPDLSLP